MNKKIKLLTTSLFLACTAVLFQSGANATGYTKGQVCGPSTPLANCNNSCVVYQNPTTKLCEADGWYQQNWSARLCKKDPQPMPDVTVVCCFTTIMHCKKIWYTSVPCSTQQTGGACTYPGRVSQRGSSWVDDCHVGGVAYQYIEWGTLYDQFCN